MSSFVVTGPSGSPTIWMPLTTAFSAPASCSSLFFQQNLYDEAGSTGVSWVLGYVIPSLLPSSATCLPSPAIASRISHTNSENGQPQTPISIGPMSCPAAWSVVRSSTDSNGLHIMCCPTAYDRFTSVASGGCITDLTIGQVLTYGSTKRGDPSIIVVTTTTMSIASTIWADPIQGYSSLAPRIAAALTSQLTSASASLSGGGGSSTGSQHTASPSSTVHPSHGLSTGAKAGIGAGAAIAASSFVSGVVMACVSLRRREKRMLLAKGGRLGRDPGGRGDAVEMQDTAVYELGDGRGTKRVVVSEIGEGRDGE